MDSYDVIVIGLGAMGSAALCELARRGHRVLGLEQFSPAHDRGSSHGQTRIIRKAYFEHPDYVPLLHQAYALWSDLEKEVGQRLLHRVGLLLAGPADGEIIAGTRAAAQIHSLPIQALTPAETIERFPGLRVDPEHVALFEEDAGYLRPEACIRAFLEVAQRGGAATLFNTPVIGWSVEGTGASVATANADYRASRLVICGGAWAGRLLADLRAPLEIRRKMQMWFACDDALYAESRGFPVFGYHTVGCFYYGFPAIESGRMKIAEHLERTLVGDPDEPGRELRPADVAHMAPFIERHLPGATDQVVASSVCMYTMTPDGHFIIDRHPKHAGVFVAAGFSGHGFKFAPLIGSVLADLAETGRSAAPIGFLSLQRLSER
ncbi:Monomeric sarcosine oxidase [Phycisphaerae bacterium RAS1]|nr:Monomeric sarcosine oxidase [Phycisphaerae bacterium RAS1]